MAKEKQPIRAQGTLDWYRERWGKITMSATIKTLMNGHVHELNRLLDLLRWQRANSDDDTIRREFERETTLGDRVEAMAWGKRHEEEAIDHYELSRATVIERPGFVTHPDFPDLIGDSTDFVELLDGQPRYVAELKCPYKSEYHLKHLRYGMPQIYFHQMQGHIEIQRAHYQLDYIEGKFVSYDPRHRIEQDKIYVQIIKPDPKWVERFYDRLESFAKHMRKGTKFEHEIGGVRDGIPSMF